MELSESRVSKFKDYFLDFLRGTPVSKTIEIVRIVYTYGLDNYSDDLIANFAEDNPDLRRGVSKKGFVNHFELPLKFSDRNKNQHCISINVYQNECDLDLAFGFILVFGTSNQESFETVKNFKLSNKVIAPYLLIGWNEPPYDAFTFEEEVKVWVEKENIPFVRVSTKEEALRPMEQFCRSLIANVGRFFTPFESEFINCSPISPFVLLGNEKPKSLQDSLILAYKKHGGVPTFITDTIKGCKNNDFSDEHTAIFLYTCEFHNSLYKQLNADLINSHDRAYTENWKYFLHYLFEGIKMIPCAKLDKVYRGVPGDVMKQFPGRYKKGKFITWYPCTSTSLIKKTVEDIFLKKSPNQHNTLFIIHHVFTARSLKEWSHYRDEEEYLLPPASTFTITNIETFNSLTTIEMEQVDSTDTVLDDFLNKKEFVDK